MRRSNGNGTASRDRTTTTIAAALSILSLSPDRAGRALAAAMSRRAQRPWQHTIADWVRAYLEPGSPGFGPHRPLGQTTPPQRAQARVGADDQRALHQPQGHRGERSSASTVSRRPGCWRSAPRCAATCGAPAVMRATTTARTICAEEVVERVITEAEELGIWFFVIIGGEPFMWPPLLDVIGRHRSSVFQVFTNGTLIDDATADRIVALGNVAPAISIEGGRERTDARRGRRHVRPRDRHHGASARSGRTVLVLGHRDPREPGRDHLGRVRRSHDREGRPLRLVLLVHAHRAGIRTCR